MVRSELMRVLAYLVTKIQEDLSHSEPGSAEPSTMETRLLRLVRTLAEARNARRSWKNIRKSWENHGNFMEIDGF